MDEKHYELLVDIRERLVRVETVGAQTLVQAKRTNGRVDDHDTRLRALESTDDKQVGATKALGGVWKFLAGIGAVAGGLSILSQMVK